MGLLDLLRDLQDRMFSERERGLSRVGNRVYVEIRGISHIDLPRFTRALEERSLDVPWIRDVTVEPFTRRAVFVVKGDMPEPSELSALLAEVESGLLHVAQIASHETERNLPDDLELERERTIETVADAASLLLGLGLRLVPLFPRRLGNNLHAAVFVVANTPRLRAPLDQRLGKARADFVLNLAEAFTQAVAQRPLGSLVSLSANVVSLREIREQRALWLHWSEDLTRHDPEPADTELGLPRPAPLPRGPMERYADRAWMIAAGTFGLSLITTRSPSRAIASGLAALPQPMLLGRELFASELSRLLAKQGTLVLAPAALRRLDRVDCLVLPVSLLSREHFTVQTAFAVRGGLTSEQALSEARALFAPERPLRVQSAGRYTLSPPRLLTEALDSKLDVEVRERAERGALVLALSRDSEVVALFEVSISPQPGVSELLSAARRASLRIVLASDDIGATEGLHPDDVIPLTRGLVDGIRRLQIEGQTVLFVARGASPGHAAADVSIGIHVSGAPAPWGAHLISPDDSRSIETAIEACAVARSVSHQSMRLSMGAAALGTLAAAGGRTGLAGRRAMFVVNSASLVAMLNAVRRSASVEHQARKLSDPTPWHALEAEGVLARLGSTRDGLREIDTAGGSPRAVKSSAVRELALAVKSELMNPLSPLLALGAGISAMVGSKADASIVAGVGGINALIGGVQRFRTERALSALISTAETRAHVRREGRVISVGESALCRGDIVLLNQGDVVPADCRILEAESLEVDTSTLTGESLPVLKSSAPSFADHAADVTSMLYAGTSIAAGRATAVVVATGADTLAQRGNVETPDEARGGVEARLRELMRLTGPVAFAAGAALVTAGMLRGRRMDDLVSTGVGLAVAAVPEGLPVLATAAQLSAAERLSRKGALVKNPRAIEALGRVDILCLDKTGTLTEGRIELSFVHDGESAEAADQVKGPRRDVLRVAAQAVAGDLSLIVDPMDAAIMRVAHALPAGARELPFEAIAARSFESSRGFASVLGRTGARTLLCVKGAPEQILARATEAWIGTERWPLPAVKARIDAEIIRFAKRGLRVVAVAERILTDEEAASVEVRDGIVADPQGLCLRGFVAFRDPLRPSSAASVLGLARAGVRVIMITGDHPSTAETVAREVSLLGTRGVLTGSQIALLTEAELEAQVAHTAVFARVTPAQKVRVVRALQRAGHVVGMVGDGANDAPAMRIADVGIAVGKHCTPAARAACDIVLADARLDALVDAVLEGRAMWSAVRDAVSILVGGNLGEIAFTVAIGGITGRPPLHPRQLLLVNFLTDIAPSMAIALRPPRPGELDALLLRGPESSLGSPLDRKIIARAITTSLGAGGAWTVGRLTGTRARARTVGLIGLVGSQLGQTLTSGGTSRSVVWTSVGSLLALGVIIQTPGLSHIFGCTPLGPIGWGTALVSSAAATLIAPLIDRSVDRSADLWAKLRNEPQEPPVLSLFPSPPVDNVIDLTPQLRLLRN